MKSLLALLTATACGLYGMDYSVPLKGDVEFIKESSLRRLIMRGRSEILIPPNIEKINKSEGIVYGLRAGVEYFILDLNKNQKPEYFDSEAALKIAIAKRHPSHLFELLEPGIFARRMRGDGKSEG